MKKCVGCGKETESKLSCPTCVKLKLPKAIFCGQECFKTNWSEHKLFHAAKKVLGTDFESGGFSGHRSIEMGFKENDISTWAFDKDLRNFLEFDFTGSLRPWPRSKQRSPPDVPLPDYSTHPMGFSKIEQKKKKKKKKKKV
eukprot:Trichotokara_eunicae@DN2873_c0_g1_i2.p1